MYNSIIILAALANKQSPLAYSELLSGDCIRCDQDEIGTGNRYVGGLLRTARPVELAGLGLFFTIQDKDMGVAGFRIVRPVKSWRQDQTSRSRLMSMTGPD